MQEKTDERKFVIDFVGKALDSQYADKGIIPDVSVQKGQITNVSSVYNPVTKGVTVYADYLPADDNDEIRIALRQNNEVISEVWSYQWLR